MITKEQLQVMSDFEVNKALAELVGHKIQFDSGSSIYVSHDGVHGCYVNYCNIPNDIMPLAFEHGINFDDGELLSFYYFTAYTTLNYDDITGAVINANCYFVDKNPLRAIACCLILVLQEKQQ